MMRPRRAAVVTASVRLEAPSLPHSEATWNLAVFSLMPRRRAMPLLGRPCGDQLEHLQLARGQRLGSAAGTRRAVTGSASEVGRQGQVEQDQAGLGRADGQVELLGVDVARQARPAAQARSGELGGLAGSSDRMTAARGESE